MSFEATKFLTDLTGRYASQHKVWIEELLVWTAMGNRPKAADARARLDEVMRETAGVAEVLGASMMLDGARGAMNFRKGDQPIIPKVPFVQAVQAMVDRQPKVLVDAAERTAQRIAQLYGEGATIAFSRSAEMAVTRRVQDLITEAIREGVSEIGAGNLISMGVNEVRTRTAAWSEAYSRTVFRTNVNTAVTAGRFRQAQDPVVKEVIPAFRFDAVGDSDTRANHKAADGLIFAVDDQVWHRIAPPLGYNCRCQVSLVTAAQLRRAGRLSSTGALRQVRLPAAAYPDPGFRHGGRPDLFTAVG